MTIQEYFARFVAAGLIPNWDNVFGTVRTDWYANTITFRDDVDFTNVIWINTSKHCEPANKIQLRKDGKDIYKLKWRKANDWESHKFFKVWYKQGTEIVLTTFTFEMLKEKCHCLLADHGNICPNVEDFTENK